MVNFYKFFKDLYSAKPLPSHKTIQLEADIIKIQNIIDELNTEISYPISSEELDRAIKGLKKGKAVTEDSIANEFLKNAGLNLRNAILNVFNQCLCVGTYS